VKQCPCRRVVPCVRPEDIHIGTAGFSYPDWLGNFYPQFCPQADFLRYYSSQFDTVELDVTFYRIPLEKTVRKWVDSTPPAFRFAAKFPRMVTHEGELKERLEQAERFVGVARCFGDKLGVLLLQFPYGFRPDSADAFRALVEVVPRDVRLAVEFRHRGWLTDEWFGWLRARNIALCLVDHAWMPRLSVQTADFRYIRLLGDQKELADHFTSIKIDREDDLCWWRDLLLESGGQCGDAYVYVNNHYSGHAPTTADRILDLMGAEEV
jgi:uncharacterized protein YecE (DUF72 family)